MGVLENLYKFAMPPSTSEISTAAIPVNFGKTKSLFLSTHVDVLCSLSRCIYFPTRSSYG